MENVGEDKAAGATSTWTGPAIVNTRVTVTVQLTVSGQPQTLTASTSYTVTPRAWPVLTLPGPLTPQVDLTHQELALYPPFLLTAAGQDSSPEGALGRTVLALDIRRHSVSAGPNKNWFYVASPITVTQFAIFTSPALEPGDAFYALRTGGRYNSSPPRYWSASDMAALKTQVVAHERGHEQTAVQYYQQHNIQADLEAMVYYVDVSQIGKPGGPDPAAAYDAAYAAAYANGYDAIQNHAVHQSGKYPVTLSCKIRYPSGHK